MKIVIGIHIIWGPHDKTFKFSNLKFENKKIKGKIQLFSGGPRVALEIWIFKDTPEASGDLDALGTLLVRL